MFERKSSASILRGFTKTEDMQNNKNSFEWFSVRVLHKDEFGGKKFKDIP